MPHDPAAGFAGALVPDAFPQPEDGAEEPDDPQPPEAGGEDGFEEEPQPAPEDTPDGDASDGREEELLQPEEVFGRDEDDQEELRPLLENEELLRLASTETPAARTSARAAIKINRPCFMPGSPSCRSRIPDSGRAAGAARMGRQRGW